MTTQATKTMYCLDSPCTEVNWPTVSPQSQGEIMRILYSLLTPIGEYRTQHLQRSKGKRTNKKKVSADQKETKRNIAGGSTPGLEQNAIPPAPAMTSSFMIGFNSVVRCLEVEARKTAPLSLQAPPAIAHTDSESHEGDHEVVSIEAEPLVAVFVARSEQSPLMVSNLPLLVATASLGMHAEAAIRLITLPKGAGTSLSTALQLPRVGLIGVRGGAPNIAPLIAYIRDNVAPVEVPWLHDVQIGRYLPTRIKAIVTTASVKPKRRASPDGGREKRVRI